MQQPLLLVVEPRRIARPPSSSACVTTALARVATAVVTILLSARTRTARAEWVERQSCYRVSDLSLCSSACECMHRRRTTERRQSEKNASKGKRDSVETPKYAGELDQWAKGKRVPYITATKYSNTEARAIGGVQAGAELGQKSGR